MKENRQDRQDVLYSKQDEQVPVSRPSLRPIGNEPTLFSHCVHVPAHTCKSKENPGARGPFLFCCTAVFYVKSAAG